MNVQVPVAADGLNSSSEVTSGSQGGSGAFAAELLVLEDFERSATLTISAPGLATTPRPCPGRASGGPTALPYSLAHRDESGRLGRPNKSVIDHAAEPGSI